jgi:hypothetical protein
MYDRKSTNSYVTMIEANNVTKKSILLHGASVIEYSTIKEDQLRNEKQAGVVSLSQFTLN